MESIKPNVEWFNETLKPEINTFYEENKISVTVLNQDLLMVIYWDNHKSWFKLGTLPTKNNSVKVKEWRYLLSESKLKK